MKADERKERDRRIAVRVVREQKGLQAPREPSAEQEAYGLIEKVLEAIPKGAFKLK